MKNKIRIPKGWRIVPYGEILKRGDKHNTNGRWMHTCFPDTINRNKEAAYTYIRRQRGAKGAKI